MQKICNISSFSELGSYLSVFIQSGHNDEMMDIEIELLGTLCPLQGSQMSSIKPDSPVLEHTVLHLAPAVQVGATLSPYHIYQHMSYQVFFIMLHSNFFCVFLRFAQFKFYEILSERITQLVQTLKVFLKYLKIIYDELMAFGTKLMQELSQ